MTDRTKTEKASSPRVGRPASYRQKLKEAMRDQILLSAERVFAEKGFGNAKVEDIARRAEVAVGTIYLHFGNKESLYFTLINAKVDRLVAHVRKAVVGVPTACEKIRRITASQLGFFQRNKLFLRTFLHETRGFEWSIQFKLGAKIMTHYRRHLKFVSAIFEQGVADGEFTGNTAPHDMAIALQGMINAFLTDWAHRKPAVDFEENTDLILDIFFNSTLRRDPDAARGGLRSEAKGLTKA